MRTCAASPVRLQADENARLGSIGFRKQASRKAGRQPDGQIPDFGPGDRMIHGSQIAPPQRCGKAIFLTGYGTCLMIHSSRALTFSVIFILPGRISP